MAEDVKNRIAELEKELYSKDFKPHTGGDILKRKEVPVASSWDTKPADDSFLDEALRIEKQNHLIIMKKFAQFSVGFFVLAAAVAGFIWWQGANVISGEKMTIDIATPPPVAGGEPFETKFVVANGNKVAVEAATLLIEYPAGFYSVTEKTELPRISKDLGVIAPGQALTENVNTILYGEENTSKDVVVTLEYRMAGSNATLKKTASYAVKIASSPVNIKLSALKEVSSGQEVEFSVDVSSNSKDPISTIIVEAVYPFGFSFKSADPTPTYSTNSWQISGLAPQETRTIKVRGIIEGQENEEKITKISVGTQSPKDERFIGVVYNVTRESTIITKPFLGLDIMIDNDRSLEHVAIPGRGVRVDVSWQSNNPSPVTDAVLEIKLKGAALNRYSVYASGGGFYRSIDDTIVWDKTTSPELRSMEPGAKGSVSFSFSPRPLDVSASSPIKNPQVTFEIRARARRATTSNILEEITTLATRSVKFETDIRLSARGTYFTGPFKNTGALPPKVNNETTYTISFTVRNSSNSVSNALVKTTLPLYVKWLGRVYPDGEGLTYNEATSEVSWNVGRIAPLGTRDASFQISFLPSLSQINQAPKLTGDITIVGTDDFTKTEVRDQKIPITTYISSDSPFSQIQTNVVN